MPATSGQHTDLLLEPVSPKSQALSQVLSCTSGLYHYLVLGAAMASIGCMFELVNTQTDV